MDMEGSYMKLISRIALIMTAVAGIVFVILGVCFMGMYGYMSTVVSKASQTTTEAIIVTTSAVVSTVTSAVSTVTTSTTGGADIGHETKEALPNFTSKGATGMLAVGLVLLVYGAACAIVSILALKKLEEAKTKKDIKVLSILACIFSFVAPGIFLLRLTDDDIREKKEYEDNRR